jgi:hypothetical protein
VVVTYTRLNSRGHLPKIEHTRIDVSEYLLGRGKFCKDIKPGRPVQASPCVSNT